jgi:hypothetical protein
MSGNVIGLVTECTHHFASRMATGVEIDLAL